MTRMMIIPAAGTGSRLGATLPKVLVPVAGRPMLEHLLARYSGAINRFVVVVSPAARDLVAEYLRTREESVEIAVQAHPTGMLDAVLAAYDLVWRHQPDRVWITWCDQVAVRRATIAGLLQAETAPTEPDLVLPTCQGAAPYIHFARDQEGRITGVRQRREGDAMPPVGESDMGLFSLSRSTYLRDLKAFEASPQERGHSGERNFLPFIPWLAASRLVVTFPCAEPIEALGINTPDDLRRIEADVREIEAGPADHDGE